MKKILLILLIFLLFSCSNKEITYKQIDSNQAKEIFSKEGNYLILDVRTKQEYESGHIPNAINIPAETISDRPSELTDLNQEIYIYCRSGNRSKQAADKLVKLGYTNIIEFGGINSWNGDIE